MGHKAKVRVQAAGDGPRATDRFSVVAAAFISGVAARAGAAEIGARFLAQLAERMECAYEEGNPLACDNLAGLLAQLYACHLVAASCVYSLLERLRARFQERDVVLIHQLLKACGFRLRAEDSSAMKVPPPPTPCILSLIRCNLGMQCASIANSWVYNNLQTLNAHMHAFRGVSLASHELLAPNQGPRSMCCTQLTLRRTRTPAPDLRSSTRAYSCTACRTLWWVCTLARRRPGRA